MRLEMPMGTPVMGVRGTESHIDQIQNTVTDTALGDDFLRKFAHSFDRTFQHHRLEALLMVQMRVHGGDGEFMMSVLNAGQTLGELTFLMIVYIREICDAGAPGVALFGTAL
jgi:hypothetical protein